MLISLHEIKQLVDISLPDADLLDLIGSRLVEIESATDWAPRYKKIYIVRVLSSSPIEGTHLHLCKIDAGRELNTSLDPDTENAIRVVCGAPNVKKDMLAVWIAPGAIVPATASDPEPLEISARKLRGHISFGMLAGLDELALGDDHSGIVELDPNMTFTPAGEKSPRKLRPGDSFASAFNLNDKIIEVENKSLTHRPDCFGLIGFAREVAGILGQPFLEPTLPTLDLPERSSTVNIESPDLCPAYTYSVINLESPLTTSPYLTPDAVLLAKSGMHSISKIVDITNLYMLRTGQPLHAFDYDKFLAVGSSDTPAISVRLARPGESLTLLDDQEIKLNPSDIVIASADTPVALAGAMGGKSTMIDASTRRVILESATFSLYNLRKTQMSHGIFSEAITRFTKGQPASNCLPVLLAATANLAAPSPDAHAEFFSATYPAPLDKIVISLSVQDINSLLGSSYSLEKIKQTLENTGFIVKTSKSSDTLSVTTPAWRTDIHIKEDIIEEVGRLLGYGNLPLTFPTRPFTCPSLDPMLALKQRIRAILSDRLNMHEIITYSFVSQHLLTSAGFSPDTCYKITNSISPDLECFRPSLLPSLLSKLPENIKAGYKDFSLFEMNQVSDKTLGLSEESVPNLETRLAFTAFGDFYRIKTALSSLAETLNIPLTLRPCNTSSTFESKHSAHLFLGETSLGTIGELRVSVLKSFKLSAPVSACELNLNPLATSVKTRPGTETERFFSADKSSDTFTLNPTASASSPFYKSRFQSSSRDLTVRTHTSVPYATLETSIRATLFAEPHLLFAIIPLSIYSKLPPFKRTSFRLTLASTEKTFSSADLSDIMEKVIKNLEALGAELV